MFRKSGPTHYYYTDDLKTMKLPPWQLTNAVPLAPDQAVLAATRHLTAKHPNITSWDVDSIEMRKEFDTIWTYNISLVDRHSGRWMSEVVSVLMDGSIWKPSSEKRSN